MIYALGDKLFKLYQEETLAVLIFLNPCSLLNKRVGIKRCLHAKIYSIVNMEPGWEPGQKKKKVITISP